MTEYTIDMIKGTTVMEQMRSLIKVVIEFINTEGGDVEEVRQMVLTEIADRTAQDGQLQLQIQAEATARISQDNSLQGQIQAETVQRMDAEATLQADLEQEAQTRQASDDALETAIQTAVQGEASARQTQDAQLSSDIQNEASQRASADSGLSHDISDLTTRVGTVETSVSEIIQGTQVVGAAQNQGYADNQGEAQVGDCVVSTTAVIGDDTHPVKIVNGVPVQVTGELQGKLTQGTGITIDANNQISQAGGGTVHVTVNSVSEAYTKLQEYADAGKCVYFRQKLSNNSYGFQVLGYPSAQYTDRLFYVGLCFVAGEITESIVLYPNSTIGINCYQNTSISGSNVFTTSITAKGYNKSISTIEIWAW